MQDNSQNSSKNVGLSKSQSIKGPPNAKKTRDGESGPGPAGTPQQNYSHLQGPQRQHYKGNQGPQPHSKSVTQKSSGLSKGSNIQITYRPVPLTAPNQIPHTQTTHPSPPTLPPNHQPPPGLNPPHHHTFPQTPGFPPFAHVNYSQLPPFAPYPPPHNPQPLPPAPNPYPPHPYPPQPEQTNSPQKARAPKNQKSPPTQKKYLSLPNIQLLRANCTTP